MYPNWVKNTNGAAPERTSAKKVESIPNTIQKNNLLRKEGLSILST